MIKVLLGMLQIFLVIFTISFGLSVFNIVTTHDMLWLLSTALSACGMFLCSFYSYLLYDLGKEIK